MPSSSKKGPFAQPLKSTVGSARLPCSFAAAALLLALHAFTSACYHLTLDTVPRWCDQIAGVNLEKKYMPFWAAFFSVSTNAEGIRDNYVKILNELYMEKIQNRAHGPLGESQTFFTS